MILIWTYPYLTQRSLPTYFTWGRDKQHPQMVFALATRRSHKNFSAFTHIKYRQLFSDIKRENQKWRKIGSVAMKIKKSILSNFFSIESTSKISHLRYEKLNFSSQNHRIDVNFFDYENWEQYLTFLFYTSGPQLPLSMRKIALL